MSGVSEATVPPAVAAAGATSASPRVPRITTRGCYDLTTGRPRRPGPTYRLYPKYYFEEVAGASELIIMVHGLRNDDRGASEKTVIAQNALQRLGHGGRPVVGFSYDANVRNAHRRRYQRQALRVGEIIARRNGAHLARFLARFRQGGANRNTRVRLLGHSLGSVVIHRAIMLLARDARLMKRMPGGIIESVHLFGASIPADIQKDAEVRGAIDSTVRGRFVNCYAPTDEVLAQADSAGLTPEAGPLGLNGAAPGRTAAKYRQRRVRPENHRFASYAEALRTFP